MYGYIYKTTNKINNKIYIGKKKSNKYIKTYLGSGKLITKEIKKYGKRNFENKILYVSETKEDLNRHEKYYINLYYKQNKENLYNIAKGGDGGNTLFNASEEEKQIFKNKMTEINSKRSKSKKSRKNISEKLKKYYKDNPQKRKELSNRLKNMWTKELREKQALNVKNRTKKLREEIAKKNMKRCSFKLKEEYKEFESIKDLMLFLKESKKYIPDRRSFNNLLKQGENDIKFNPFFKRHYHLKGMIIKKIKDVSTNCDECNSVRVEISTTLKDEALRNNS